MLMHANWALLAFAFLFLASGCKERSVAQVRAREAVSSLRLMLGDGTLADSERSNATAGITLLENGVSDESPLIVMARVIRPTDQTESHLGIKYVSEVYSGGTLELLQESGTWKALKVAPVHPFSEADLYLRYVLVRSDELSSQLPMSAEQMKGMKVRLVIAGNASNVVDIR